MAKATFNPKIKQLHTDVFCINFGEGNQYFMNSTMMRMQEFYESPYSEIYNKKFTIEFYMDLVASKEGNFTYYEDVLGINVPGTYVDSFFKIFKDDLSSKETHIRDLLIDNNILNRKKKYYIIAVADKKEHLRHEIAHALYFVNKDYKKEARALNKQYKHKKQFRQCLIELGYDRRPDIIEDEIQAIFGTETLKFIIDSIDAPRKIIPMKLRTQYRKIFKKYVKFENIKIK